MQFTVLGFSQTKLIEYNLTIIDVHILRWFVDFYQTGKMVKMTDEQTGFIYSWVKYEAVLNDLPLLGITNVRVVARRFDAMCECGLIRKIVRKTAKGSYSCFRLDPDKYNELLSKPVNTQSRDNSEDEAMNDEERNTQLTPKSAEGVENTDKDQPTVQNSTVASTIQAKDEASVLKSTVAQKVPEKIPPTVQNSTVASTIQAKDEATVLKSTVATVQKSTVLLVNSSSTPNPLTKIPASAVYQVLMKLDPTLILDNEFYPAAADFLSNHNLGEEYIKWFYQHLKDSKRINNLAGYIFKVFFKDIYIQRFKAFLAAKAEQPKSQDNTRHYTCPVCGLEQNVTSVTRACARCDSPLDPAEVDIAKYHALYSMDDSTKELYIAARSRVLRSGGNVGEKLKDLDKQFGLVS